MVEVRAALAAEVRELARERDAVIFAHNYQRAEVQQVADIVGDSLELARRASEADAAVIVLAGVRFMAETAAILATGKTVLLPHTGAGCPMADMITAAHLSDWKAEFPGVPVVMYVNSSAEVKALTDVCCTSANAVEVVRSLGSPRVLFAPDRNLGAWVAAQLPEIEVIAWNGYCPVHDEVTLERVRDAQALHPDAVVIAHPECRPEVSAAADAVLSTSQMMRYAAEAEASEFIVVTEAGLLHGLQAAAPEKRFYHLAPAMICADMKLTRLEHVRDALADLSGEVVVPAAVADAARASLERMTAIG
ncbi:MAG: quinolinate synthase NadA [Coriobacteriia bacterium]|nr:quinolinate synthase NadA [Coriobacteriia bacterium]MBN2847248.1 quinolinate synthase NadA [Coriobacteriia bacterium]